MSRTLEVAKAVEQHFLTQEKANTAAIFIISGFNFSGSGQNADMAFVALKDWNERRGADNRADAIAARATRALASVRDAQVFTMNPPAIQGLGQSGGFEFQLQADAGTTRAQLKTLRDSLMTTAAKDPQLTAVRAGGMEDTPQLRVDVDQAKAFSLGLSLPDVNATLSSAWADTYVNDFIDRSRVKKVYMQADAPFRSRPEDLTRGGCGALRARGRRSRALPRRRGPTALKACRATTAWRLMRSRGPLRRA